MPIVTSHNCGYTVTVDRSRNIATIERGSREVRVVDAVAVNQVVERVRTVEVSSPGPQGTAGTPGGTAEARIASEVLGGHRIVRSTSATGAGYADPFNPQHGDDTLGLTLGAAALDAEVQVQRIGPVTHDGWAWTPGEPVFLGAAGVPTQVPPGGAFEQVIGYAESATTLNLRIEPPVYAED